MSFRIVQVTDRQVEEAFAVLQATAAWLAQRGSRQRIAKISLEKYRRWQAADVNYAVCRDDQIAGVFSLPVEDFADWPEFRSRGSAIWLRALATHPDFRGRDVGKRAVQWALRQAGEHHAVYLDCVSGFLPQYYGQLGFELLARQVCDYGVAGRFDITLMCHAASQPGRGIVQRTTDTL